MNANGDVAVSNTVSVHGAVFEPQWALNASNHACTTNALRIGAQKTTTHALDVEGDAKVTGTLTVTSRLSSNRLILSSSSPTAANGDLYNSGGVLRAFLGGGAKTVWLASHNAALSNIAAASVPASKFTGTIAESHIPSLPTSRLENKYIAYMSVQNFPTSKITGTITTAQVPNLNASKVTSGAFAASQISGLATSLVNAGTFTKARGGTGATTFTSNALIKATSTGLGTASNITVSGANVGIGRTPSFPLDVAGGMFVGAGWHVGVAPRLSYVKAGPRTAAWGDNRWIRVATNGPVNGTNSGGDRCHGLFTVVMDYPSLPEEGYAITFYAGCMFGSQRTLRIIHGGFASWGLDKRVRIVTGGTYAGTAVDVYQPSGTTMTVYMHENFSTNGFILSLSTNVTIPSGFTTIEKDCTEVSSHFVYGALGTFAVMMYYDSSLANGTRYEPGTLVQGSHLTPCGTFHNNHGSWAGGFAKGSAGTVSGTWRLHSRGMSYSGHFVSLYQRVA